MVEEDLILSLVEEFGTPFYLIEESSMIENLNKLRRAFSGFKGRVEIAYSVKANFNPLVLRVFSSEGTMFDVASEEELYFVRKAGIEGSKVIYSSVTETKRELELAVSQRARLISLSSKNGFLRLKEILKRMKAEKEVLVRINPGLDVKATIPASGSWSKFGVPLEKGAKDSALWLMREAVRSKSVEPVGVHFHLGSQVLDPKSYSLALNSVLSFLSWTLKRVRADIRIIDVGGGYPVKYDSEVPPLESFSSKIVEALNRWAEEEGFQLTLIVESGRFLIASAGALVTSVVNVKEVGGSKLVIADAGYNLLLDTALLKQVYPVRVIKVGTSKKGGREEEVRLAGYLCDSLDFFFPPRGRGRGIVLPKLEVGDLLVFEMAGAYTNVFNLPFNCKTKPPILFVSSNGRLLLARPRESVERLYEDESP